jgi:hypothetical protein
MHPQADSKPISNVVDLVERYVGSIMSAGEDEAVRCTNEGGTPPEREPK